MYLIVRSSALLRYCQFRPRISMHHIDAHTIYAWRLAIAVTQESLSHEVSHMHYEIVHFTELDSVVLVHLRTDRIHTITLA